MFKGDQKVRVQKPRIHGPEGEMKLPSYEKLKDRGEFSEELLARLMAGLSARRYKDVVIKAADAVGVSASSVSRHFVEASAMRLKEFTERSIADFAPFAIMLDTVHRGGIAFIVALGIDIHGKKKVLGFWEGATENNEIAKALLTSLEGRQLKLNSHCLFVTDGGNGIIKAIKDKYYKKLMHQRCVIHKGNNLQKHVTKKYRDRVYTLFTRALAHTKYDDARKALQELEKWCAKRNQSLCCQLID